MRKNQNNGDSEKTRAEQVSRWMFSRRTVLGSTLAGIMGTLLTASANTTSGSTFTAVSDGNWSDPATWERGSVPTDGSDVSISDSVTVTVTQPITTRVKHLNVVGTLRHAPDQDSKLRAETIETQSGSRYEIGTTLTPVQQGVTAEVEFIDEGPIDENEWPKRRNKGLLAKGEVEIVGARKTPWTTLARHPAAGDTSIELSIEPTNWNPGDKIVVPGLEHYTSTDLDNKDEERVISSIKGTTVDFDTALEYDHIPPKSGLDSYLLNLSRNVFFTSENKDEHRRGHVMIMSTGSELRYIRFAELGRTNKNQYITNPVRGEDELPDGLDPNPAARYPLHWHKTGIEAEPHRVEGTVVEGSPGWGIVNHHAHAEVTDSITYDVLGAGFVAEGGNERGSFKRNFALRSEGSGEQIDSRAAGKGGGSPPIDDLGHAGHGFWLQSPLVEVEDNVAAGHRHFGVVFWLRPLLEGEMAECDRVEDGRVTFCPNLPMQFVEDDHHDPMLEAIERGRFSHNHDELARDTQKVNTTFVRLKNVSNNEIFASAGGLDLSRHNFKWKHERFSDFSVIDDLTVYNIGTFVDEDGDKHSPKLPRHRSIAGGGNAGISLRYASNITLKNSHIVGTGRDNSVGVPAHDYLWTTTIDDCTIENWDWGADTGEHRLTWIQNCTFNDNNYDVNWSLDNVGPAILEKNDLDLVRCKFKYNNQKAAEVLTFSQSRGVRIDGRSTHLKLSRPDYVPFPDEDALDGVNNIEDIETVDDETNLVGLTNAEMLDEFGICIGGRLLPDDAVEEPFLEGSLLDSEATRTPPTSVWLDAANASGGAFDVVSEEDAANGKALRCTGPSSPKDDPASVEFECASGTYTVYGRIWPDSWNGNTVYFRIDGGEWKAAEKLKTPVGFKWHDASPNGGEPYEWQLSEGTHTLEIACGNDDVRIDEIFVGSDTEVLGAYGESARNGNTTDNTAPSASDDSASATKGGSVTVDVLANDSDSDGSLDTSSVTVVNPPSHGTATVNSDGTIDYTHDDSDTTADSFTYTVDDDDNATSNEATVSVSVTSSEETFSVTTKAATDVGDTSATLNGSLDELGGADSADCYFEWRQADASSWNTTPKQTLSNTGTFSIDISGLPSDTDYEYRAVADASDGDATTGSPNTFTTSSANAAPVAAIDDVSEDDSLLGLNLNSHVEFDVSWNASDPDDDLDAADLTLYDDTDNETEDSKTIDINGGDASDTTTLEAKDDEDSGNDYTVKLVVTDSSGNTDTDTASVSET